MKESTHNIQRYLKNNEVEFDVSEEQDAVYFRMGGTTADILVSIRIQNDNIILVTARLAINLPTRAYPKLLDALNEINRDALIATMYLYKDEDGGNVVAQAFILSKEEELEEALFMRTLLSTIARINGEAEHILKIAFGGDESLSELLLKQQIEESQRDTTLN